MAPLSADDSFDYFGPEDSAFLQELRTAVVPGDAPIGTSLSAAGKLDGASGQAPAPVLNDTPFWAVDSRTPPCAQPSKRRRPEPTSPRADGSPTAKRPRREIHLSIFDDIFDDPSSEEPSQSTTNARTPASPSPQTQGQNHDRGEADNIDPLPNQPQRSDANDGYLGEEIYGAAHFGNMGEYMRRKRAKLQIQNGELDGRAGGHSFKSLIFKGISIYINGHTQPSVQELRKLIVEHGGVFQAYLDRKSLVTHVITCSLTPAKVREFQNLKVVRPEWVVESVEKGTLLHWRNYLFQVGGRVEGIQGRNAQSSMHSVNAQRAQTASNSTSYKPHGPSRNGHNQTSDARTNGLANNVPQPIPAYDVQYGADDSLDLDLGGECEMSFDADPAGPGAAIRFRVPRPKSVLATALPAKPAVSASTSKVPSYARGPNEHAARAMQDSAWRAAHTSVAPNYIEGYYRNSRLHYLSTWKAELRALVIDAQERAERGEVPGASDHTKSQSLSMRSVELASLKGKGKARDDGARVIMHVDFDAFFVSAGLVDRPGMKGKPVVVCHSQGSAGGASSTSEIASASYEAREFGIKNGMSLQQARQLCPTVLTIPYEFDKYKKLSLKFYTILMSLADDLQAVSVDEALIEVTSVVAQLVSETPVKDLAEAIRAQVVQATGCTVSVGIAHNIMMARIATRKAKPDGSYHLTEAEVPNVMADLNMKDLHGFGSATCDKAQEKLGTTNLGELTKRSRAVLCDALGKGTGETLWKALRGIDERKLESDKPRKSVSCEINYGIRFEDDGQVERFVHQMAEEVSRRLQAIDKKGRSLTLKVMKRDPDAPVEAPKFMGHGICVTYNKQSPLFGPLGRATDDSQVIGVLSWKLLKAMNIPPQELRGLGLQVQKLDDDMPAVPAGQSRLLFQSKENAHSALDAPAPDLDAASSPSRMPPPQATVNSTAEVDLPNLSQLDQDVYSALPEDIRVELDQEYKRRSVTPAAEPGARPRAPSTGLVDARASSVDVPASDLARITKALAPRTGSHGPHPRRMYGIFARPVQRAQSAPPRVDQAELISLGLDPEVFAVLPVKVQREQLAQARGLATRPSQRPTIVAAPLKAPKQLPKRLRYIDPLNEIIPPPPPPFANHIELPTLRKPKKNAQEVQEDAQALLGQWFSGFQIHVPHRRDVDHFSRYLARLVESDLGAEHATAMMRWFRVLLRRSFARWEDIELDEDVEEMLIEWTAGQRTFESDKPSLEVVGCAWWKTFGEIKSKMNEVTRKRFGGSLAFK